MDKTMKIRTGIIAISLALMCASIQAQPRQHTRRGHGVTTIIVKPAAKGHGVKRTDRKDRLAMAVAHLRTNRFLTVKKYAKMTGLTHATAEAELEIFAADRCNPVVRALKGKKKIYTMLG